MTDDAFATDLPPRRPHVAWIVVTAVRQLRGLVIPLIFVLVAGGGDAERWVIGFGFAAVVLGLIERTLSWHSFRYEVTGGELRVRSGLLSRNERSVPLERIQAVDITETPLERVFGVVGVHVETAAGGGSAADVTIDAVSRPEAEWLRDRLASVRRRLADTPAGATAALIAPAGEVVIRRLTTSQLLLAGVTSGRFAPVAAVLSFALQLLDDVMPGSFWERFALGAPNWSPRGVVILVLVVALGAWLLAIVGTVVTFAGFELRRDGDRLLIAHGLLDRRRTIPLRRLQAVTVAESPIRRPFGLATVRFESAGFGKDTAESGVLFPLLPLTEVDELLAAATPVFSTPLDQLPLAPPPPRALLRYVLADVWSIAGLALAATVVARLVDWAPWWWGTLPLLAAPVAALDGLLRFRQTGWAIDGERRLIARGGGFAQTTAIYPSGRLQRRWQDQNPLQRRAALASFGAAVASGGTGGRFRLNHFDEATVGYLLDAMAPLPAAREPAHPLRDDAPVVPTSGR